MYSEVTADISAPGSAQDLFFKGENMRKNIFITVVFFLVFIYSSYAQSSRAEIAVAPAAEAVMFGYSGFAYGGGICADYGTDKAAGIKLLYAMDADKFIFVEFQVFVRYYFFGDGQASGLFLQGSSGLVFFSLERPEYTGYGSISAGLGAGWRYLIGKRFFAEAAVRAGYPYAFGGLITAGVRF